MRDIRVASVQFEHADGDAEANLAKVRAFTEKAKARGAELVAFPECCLTGYNWLRRLTRDEVRQIAEPIPGGESSQALLSLAGEHSLTVCAGLIEAAEDGALYDSYVVAMPDGRSERHRKLHQPPSEHMQLGSDFTVFETPHGRMAVLICFDNNIVENVRSVALMGADILIAPHQTGAWIDENPRVMRPIDRGLWDNRKSDPEAIEAELRGPKGREWLMRWLPARAYENGIFIVFSNGIGMDDDEVRTGNAMIIDPYGDVLAETGRAEDDMVVADLTGRDRLGAIAQTWMQHRRPELYGLLVDPGMQESE